ncbi:MAG: ComEC/Rec2 family competence protein [Sphingobium sp.]|nr:ComEC/Rec2 family competence protein [Sphingobium sp.]
MLSLGIGAWFVLSGPLLWVGWISGCALLALFGLLLPGEGRLRHGVIVAALLAATGCVLIWGKALLRGEAPLAHPVFTEIRGEVVSVEAQPALKQMRLIIAPGAGRLDLPRHIRVTIVQRDWKETMQQGAVLSFRVRLMPPAPPAVPGAYDFASRAYFMGIGATGRALAPIEVIRPAESKSGGVRQRLSDHIRRQLPGSEGAIAATLATGDRGAITMEDAQAMRRSGLAHLLSISGLHVSALIGAVIFLTYRLLALNRRLALQWPLMLIAALMGAIAGTAYTFLTGAEVPTIRSCLAALLVLGGLALGREAISLRLVAAGCLIVLIFWPDALVGPSFQMSFMAVTVIVALMESAWFRRLTLARDEIWLKKAGRVGVSLFVTGVAIEFALMPIALHHFHQAGLLGAFANLIVIPLTTFVIMPAEALALLADIVGLGAPFWWITGKAMGLMLWVAHGVAEHPWAMWALPVTSAAHFVIAVLGMLWLIIWQSPARFWGAIVVGAAIGAMMLTPVPDVVVSGDGRHMTVRQGDGRIALLRSGAGDYVHSMMGGAIGEADELNLDERMIALADVPGARCSAEFCVVSVPVPQGEGRWNGKQHSRQWTIMAARNDMWVNWQSLVDACRRVDIVVSGRSLPMACKPRWMKLDKAALSNTGGVGLYLGNQRMQTVRKAGDEHPWISH